MKLKDAVVISYSQCSLTVHPRLSFHPIPTLVDKMPIRHKPSSITEFLKVQIKYCEIIHIHQLAVFFYLTVLTSKSFMINFAVYFICADIIFAHTLITTNRLLVHWHNMVVSTLDTISKI